MVQMSRFFEKIDVIIFAIEKLSGVASSAFSRVTIRGTNYSNVTGPIVVQPGEDVIFRCYGNASNIGYIVIDGKEVASSDSSSGYISPTYTWSIPDGISKVSVSIENKNDIHGAYGRITVTTS